jgi:hypothetical protein
MKHEIKKLSKIVDELITFCFQRKSHDMTISIKDRPDYFKVKVVVDNIDFTEERVVHLEELLNSGRQLEMEEYYWELAGECDCDSELCLIGMMVDKAEVEYNEPSLTIKLYRYKVK